MSKNNQMEDAIISNFPWTSEELASEFNMSVQTFRVWKNKVEKAGKLVKPKIPSTLCIKDPQNQNRILYSNDYFERIKQIRGTVATRKPEVTRRAASLRSALMKVTVPIFDENIAKFLKRKFKSEQGIESHLQDHLRDLAVPALSKINELKKRHEKELEEALAEL